MVWHFEDLVSVWFGMGIGSTLLEECTVCVFRLKCGGNVSAETMVHVHWDTGTCPLRQWYMSTETLVHVHWDTGTCPLRHWYMSTETLACVHWDTGTCPLRHWYMSAETLARVHRTTFLGAFATLLKVIVTLVMSVHLSVSMAPTKCDVCVFFGNLSRKLKFHLNLIKIMSTVQYSTVLYSIVLYSIVQYCTVQYCTVQYSTVLYCTWTSV